MSTNTLISRTDLEVLVESGAVVLVDALPASYYDQMHLPRALNLVESDVVARAAELLPDKDAAIVTYCSNAACGNSQAVPVGSSASATPTSGSTPTASRTGSRAGTPRRPAQRDPPPGNTHHSPKENTSMTTTTTSPTRTVAGRLLPSAGTWEIDPGHTDLAFVGRHFMVTKVRGRFTGVTGAVVVADQMSLSHVEVTIDMASVESGSAVRDDHIRSAELFDVERFPQASFRSTAVEWSGSRGTVHGDLTIHGVTRTVPLEVTFEGHVRDPWGGDRAIFSAHTKVNREDFGVSWNQALETGGVLVSKEIQIEINLETVLRRD